MNKTMALEILRTVIAVIRNGDSKDLDERDAQDLETIQIWLRDR